jgi:hypothetical protein
MKPRFANAIDKPPVYVKLVARQSLHSGFIRFHVGDNECVDISFANQLELNAMFQRLIDERVPFSAGGASIGSIDEAQILIKDGVLRGSPIEISWSSPNKWTIREISFESLEWDEVAHADEIANCRFDPNTLKNLSLCYG